MTLEPASFFDLNGYEHSGLFEGVRYPWEALKRLSEYIQSHLVPEIHGRVMEGAFVFGDVYLGEGAVIEPGAMVKGPVIIGSGAVIRHGAYVRENCVIGAECVIGHTSELKGTVVLDGGQVPHFSYVGDSILGRNVNLGAGTKISNLKNDGSEVVITWGDQKISTGLRKFGAILGDRVHTGCNCVTSPGTLVGPNTLVYAGAVLRGVYPPDSIVKLRQSLEVAAIERRA